MSIIRIKRSGTNGSPTSLAQGEMAYSFLGGTEINGGDRLYIGTGTETGGAAANIEVIGGKYFTAMLDHTPGMLTASSALIVDANSKIDNLNVDNININGNTISSTDINGNIVLDPNGTGTVDVSGAKIRNLATPTANTDAANKAYVDTEIAALIAGPYSSHAAFLAAVVPAAAQAAHFLAAGMLVTVRRAAAGSIISADGSRWEPADGVYSPLHYGARADGSDDGAALNAAFSAFRAAVNASATGVSSLVLDLMGRTYTTTVSINGTGIIRSGWVVKNGSIVGKCTGKCVLDLIGSRMGKYADITVYGDKDNMPSVGIQASRSGAGALAFCDNCEWTSIKTRGYFQTVGLWAYGQETTKYTRCSFWNSNPSGAVAFLVGTDDFEYNGTRPMLMQSDYLPPITGETSYINNHYDNVDFRYLPTRNIYNGTTLTRGAQTVFTTDFTPTNFFVGQRVVFLAEGYQTSAYGTIGTITAISGKDITVSIDSSGWAAPAGQVWSLVGAQTGPTIVFGRARGQRFSSCYCVTYGDYPIDLVFGARGLDTMDNIDLDFLFEGGSPGYIRVQAERSGLGLTAGSIRTYQVRCQNHVISSTGEYPIRLYDMQISVPGARHATPLIFDDPSRYQIVGGSIYTYQADRLPRSGWSVFRTEVVDRSGAVTSYGISRAGSTDVKQLPDGSASLDARYLDSTGTLQGFQRYSIDTHAFIFSCNGAAGDYNMTAEAFYPSDVDLTDLGLASRPWRAVYAGGYVAGGAAGVSGTYTTADGKTVTVTGGIITAIV